MATVTVTFVRHGESTDNLKTVWAGWADAPLSNHGMNQARAAAAFFAASGTRFTAIYASPLKRAHSTAEAILSAHAEPKPDFIVNLDVREQYFGDAEGKKWASMGDGSLTREELYARGIYPWFNDRESKFPNGESLDDLQERAERAVNDIVVPYIWRAMLKGEPAHIAIVSHGLCISELVAAIVRKDAGLGKKATGHQWTGLRNTAWTRLEIGVERASSEQAGEGAVLPPVNVKITHIDQGSHLDSVKRQHGGIGSSAYDPAQQDIRAFFGGRTKPSADSQEKDSEILVEDQEEGRALSNALDEELIPEESKQ